MNMVARLQSQCLTGGGRIPRASWLTSWMPQIWVHLETLWYTEWRAIEEDTADIALWPPHTCMCTPICLYTNEQECTQSTCTRVHTYWHTSHTCVHVYTVTYNLVFKMQRRQLLSSPFGFLFKLVEVICVNNESVGHSGQDLHTEVLTPGETRDEKS